VQEEQEAIQEEGGPRMQGQEKILQTRDGWGRERERERERERIADDASRRAT